MAAVVGLEDFDIEAVEVPCLHSRWIAALAARRLVLVVSVVVDLDLHADPVFDWSECCLGETQDSQGLFQDGWKAMVRSLENPDPVYSHGLGIVGIEHGQLGWCPVVEIFLVRS